MEFLSFFSAAAPTFVLTTFEARMLFYFGVILVSAHPYVDRRLAARDDAALVSTRQPKAD